MKLFDIEYEENYSRLVPSENNSAPEQIMITTDFDQFIVIPTKTSNHGMIEAIEVAAAATCCVILKAERK